MTQLARKIATAKNIPLLALALFMAMFMGSEVLASMRSAMAPSAWTFEPTDPTDDPTDPEHYVPYSGDLNDLCEQVIGICGIIAEEDPLNPGQPLIPNDLKERIEAGETGTKAPDVFLLPMQ